MILVLGVPRSGTSAIAGVLHHLGVDMGESLPADEWNIKGFYQDKYFEKAISKTLRYPFPKFKSFVDCPEVTNLSKNKIGLWGLKTNRIVYCLPSLLAGVDECKIITSSRPLEESIASYQARSRCTIEFAKQQLDNVNEAIREVIPNPDLIVPFHELLNDRETWVKKIAEIANLPVSSESVDWINASLRRFP